MTLIILGRVLVCT